MAALTDRLAEAVEKFREGRYFEAHGGFEDLWRAAAGGDRDLYQGWVLVCAALFHRDRGNARGAASCLKKAEEHWGRVTPEERRTELDGILSAVRRVQAQEWVRPDLTAGTDRGTGEKEEWC